MNVRFFAGTKADYLNLPAPKNPLGLYFCADTQELFWADRLLTDGIRVVPTQQDLPELQNAAEGIVYYVTETRNGYVLPRGGSDWLQIIYAPTPSEDLEVDLSGYYTKTEVEEVISKAIADIKIEAVLSEYALKSDIPSLDGYATADFVTQKISEAELGREDVDLSGYATKDELPTKVSQLENDRNFITREEVPEVDLSEYAKKSEIPAVPTNISAFTNDAGYLQSIPSEYITESELNARDYLTEHQSLEGYATEQYVDNAIAALNPIVEEVKTKLEDEVLPKVEETILPTIQKVEEVLPTVQELAEKAATQEWVSGQGYLTEHQDLSAYAKKADIPAVPTKVSELENDTKFITEANLADYAKKSDIPVDYITSTKLQEELNKIEHPSTDLTNYVTRDEIDGLISEIPAEYVTETELAAKGYLTTQNLSGYATESFVNEAIANIDIPKVNTDAFVTTETLAQTLGNKANEVPFDTDKFVTNPIGNFVVGETLKGLSISEIFAKILGLSDVAPLPPDIEVSIKDKILNNELSLYVLNEAGELVEESYKFKTFDEATANSAPVETCFYVINNPDGKPEYGYQHITETKEMYYIVALPTELVLGETAKLMTWDAAGGAWTDVDASTLTNNYEVISGALAEVDLVLPTLEGYTFWADLNTVDPGARYRFIITEEV